MTTRRPASAGMASTGVHHIAKVTSTSNAVFHEIHQENDIGNDAFIEFIVSGSPIGCVIAAQIKSGDSYIRNGRFILRADAKHFEYWRSYPLPVCGFVYDPASDTARWVDITAHVNDHPMQFTIEVPDENVFDQAHFDSFRDHFLSYRERFSEFANFGRSLSHFSHLEDSPRCESGIRALFSFHRGRNETWYYVISTINNFRGHPLLRLLVATLAHVPGHMDIFWVPDQNVVPEPVSSEAELLLRSMLSRESILTLLSVVEEGGFERGTIGQCVASIVAVAPDRRDFLASIALDAEVQEPTRYWALLLLILYEQRPDREYCARIAEKAAQSFTCGDHQECARGLLETLRTPGQFV
jgi:hypothetical protein